MKGRTSSPRRKAARRPGVRAAASRPSPGRAPGGAGALDLRPLPARFFRRPTLDVARDLLGRLLLRRSGSSLVGGWIVEVEAYVGEDDPACHAAAGRTARNGVMYGEAGRTYVYFTYGMHHCVNVVTAGVGEPEAVLIRALEPAVGQMQMRRRRGALVRDIDLARGPGRLCQALGIDLKFNGVALGEGRSGGPILFLARGRPGPRILGISSRIGIRRGVDRPWRFFDPESAWVSRTRPSRAGRRVETARRAQHSR